MGDGGNQPFVGQGGRGAATQARSWHSVVREEAGQLLTCASLMACCACEREVISNYVKCWRECVPERACDKIMLCSHGCLCHSLYKDEEL